MLKRRNQYFFLRYIRVKNEDKVSDNEFIPNVEQYPILNYAVCNNDIPAKNNSNVNYCND